MEFGLSAENIDKIRSVFAEYPEVEKVIIYGSRAKGNYRHNSDIDLTLIGEQLNLDIQFRIDESLDNLLLPYTIDLSVFSQISNPDLVEHIQRVGVVFYQNKID
ncbi:MAG TPA: nucleotidyltransferase domain-containing protein [Fluviicola sp.]|nr:nucleotidyltransferase domain-containing protein [Fluviicola sp.]